MCVVYAISGYHLLLINWNVCNYLLIHSTRINILYTPHTHTPRYNEYFIIMGYGAVVVGFIL